MLNPLQPWRSTTPPPPTFRHAAAGPTDTVELGASPPPVPVRLTRGTDDGVRDAIERAFRADVQAGVPPAESEASLHRLHEALEERRRLWEWQLVPVFDTYAQTFAGTPDAKAGMELLTFLAEQRVYGEDAATAAREVAQPLDGMPLAARTELFAKMLQGAEDPEAAVTGWVLLRAEVEAGRDGGAAVARVRQLAEGMRKAGLKQDHQQKPVMEACRQHLAQAPALLPGWPLRLLEEGVKGDELLQAIREAGDLLGPLVRGAAAPELEAALSAPWKGSWKTHLEELREMLAMARGPEPAGTIGEEETRVIIGGITLPKRV